MSREWQPGDVAIRRSAVAGVPDYVSMVVERCDHHQSRPHWHLSNGGWTPLDSASIYRPLVVIDPEDREAVERLDDLLWASVNADTAQADLQAALREFASPTPPKPDEPLGLGAVVEDADGLLWCRDVAGDDPDGPWYRRGVPKCKQYAEITAVRVLSEGVS